MKFNQFAWLALLGGTLAACGGGSSSDGDTSSSSSSSSVGSAPEWGTCERFDDIQGFASQGNGTTGGADLGSGNNVVGVITGTEIISALNNPEFADQPLTIYIDDLITWENSGSQAVRIRRDNVSIIGRSANAGFEGAPVEISHGASNIIIRNLTMRLVPQNRSPGDIISIDGRDEGGVSNVWIDHNELYNSREAPAGATCADIGKSAGCDINKDYYDELVSGRGAVKNVTISYNHLHDAWKTSLWGSSDNATEEDVGRTITFHHNHWENVHSRLPLFRFGEGHVFNNYYQDVTGTGINSRMGAEMRIDGNVFENASHPIVSIDSDELGHWDVEDNQFINVSASGSCNGSNPPCRNAHEESTTSYSPSYTYEILPSEEVKTYVLEHSGAGVVNDCLDMPEPEEREEPEDVGPKDPPESWNVWDASALPDAEDSITLADGTFASFSRGGNSTEESFFSAGTSTGEVTFDSTGITADTQNAVYTGVVNNTADYPKHFTAIAGVTGTADDVRVLEIEIAMADEGEAGSRLKTILRADGSNQGIQLEKASFNEESPDYYELDMTQYHVYHISITLSDATTGTVNIYVDGEETPVISLPNVPMRASGTGDNFIRIGDGGGHAYKSTIDWLIWTNEDAYRPSDIKGHVPTEIGDTSAYAAETEAE